MTHVNPDNKILLSEIIRKLDLMPFVTVLLKVSKDEVVRRLKKRNNAIDNSLDIDRLYELYYNSPRLELGEVIELVNESESDLEKNVVTIAKKITKLKK